MLLLLATDCQVITHTCKDHACICSDVMRCCRLSCCPDVDYAYIDALESCRDRGGECDVVFSMSMNCLWRMCVLV